jgi:hypothetical protein
MYQKFDFFLNLTIIKTMFCEAKRRKAMEEQEINQLNPIKVV